MAKANVLISAAGWLLGFTEKLVAELKKRGVTDEAIHQLVTKKGDTAVEKIADELARLMKSAKNLFVIVVGDYCNTEEVIRAGNYNWSSELINGKNFPMRSRKPGKVTVEFINGNDFDHDPTSEEVLSEAKKRGLDRPVYEDALLFGEQHPEVQKEEPVVFLHEPWRDFGGVLRVVSLWSYCGGRWLYLDYFAFGWYRGCRFAFVRK